MMLPQVLLGLRWEECELARNSDNHAMMLKDLETALEIVHSKAAPSTGPLASRSM